MVICVVASLGGFADVDIFVSASAPASLSSAYYINHVTSAHSNLFIAEFANESSTRHPKNRTRRLCWVHGLLSSSILEEQE